MKRKRVNWLLFKLREPAHVVRRRLFCVSSAPLDKRAQLEGDQGSHQHKCAARHQEDYRSSWHSPTRRGVSSPG